MSDQPHPRPLLIGGLTVYCEPQQRQQAGVYIADGKLCAIDDYQQLCAAFPQADRYEFPDQYALLPGFIDCHIHGAAGADVMDATDDALKRLCQTLPKEGTTAFLATTLSAPVNQIDQALTAIANYHNQSQQGAEIVGIHLEGPFLAPEKAGAHQRMHLRRPEISLLKHWQSISDDRIRCVTLAPELPESTRLIEHCINHNMIAAIGHTHATHAQAQQAIDLGCTHATHLFNAMSGLHHRQPGAALACLLDHRVVAELIADTVHVHPQLLNLAYQIKGSTHIALVTDAMRAKCLSPGQYTLGDTAVWVDKERVTLADGTLAGSILCLHDALINMQQITQCTMADLVKMSASVPAQQCGVFDRKGSLEVGKDADCVVLDEHLQPQLTVCRGYVAFDKKIGANKLM